MSLHFLRIPYTLSRDRGSSHEFSGLNTLPCHKLTRFIDFIKHCLAISDYSNHVRCSQYKNGLSNITESKFE